jgi:hypothetical protein
MAYLKSYSITRERDEYFDGFRAYRERQRPSRVNHVELEFACNDAELDRLLEFFNAQMGVSVQAERPALTEGLPALPPGPIEAEFIDEEPIPRRK